MQNKAKNNSKAQFSLCRPQSPYYACIEAPVRLMQANAVLYILQVLQLATRRCSCFSFLAVMIRLLVLVSLPSVVHYSNCLHVCSCVFNFPASLESPRSLQPYFNRIFCTSLSPWSIWLIFIKDIQTREMLLEGARSEELGGSQRMFEPGFTSLYTHVNYYEAYDITSCATGSGQEHVNLLNWWVSRFPQCFPIETGDSLWRQAWRMANDYIKALKCSSWIATQQQKQVHGYSCTQHIWRFCLVLFSAFVNFLLLCQAYLWQYSVKKIQGENTVPHNGVSDSSQNTQSSIYQEGNQDGYGE